MAIVTIPNVEIMETGKFVLASGETTFTSEHLAAAIAALQDPAIHAPRLKLGHTKEHGQSGPSIGQPVIGRAANMRLEGEGNKLISDYAGVPAALEEPLTHSYPSRSIEGEFDFVSATGRKHAFVIHAISLLGEELPGISTLEDLVALYDDPAVTATMAAAKPVVATFSSETLGQWAGRGTEGTEMSPARRRVKAAADPGVVYQSFYSDFAKDEYRWWWIHELFISPMEIIAEDEDTNTYHRVPYSIGNDDEVTFGEPVAVKKQYVAAARSSFGQPARSFKTRAESRPDNQEDNDMKLSNEQKVALRQKLGLAEDASEDTILQALSAPVDGTVQPTDEVEVPEGTEASGEGSDGSQADGSDAPAGTQEQPAPVAAQDGTVRVDRAVWASTQADAAAGREARNEQVMNRQDGKVEAALRAGKIPPSRKAHWVQAMRADEEGTSKTLDELASGLIPVKETGTANESKASAGDSGDAYPDWLNPGGAGSVSARQN